MEIVTRIMFRGLLRGLAEEGHWCHQQVEKTHADQRAGWRRTKNDLGYRARIAGLAYGMLRGRAYAEIEFRKEPLHEVAARGLVFNVSALLKALVPHGDRFAWREDAAIEKWLKTEPCQALLEAHEAAEERGRQQRAEARAKAAERRLGGTTVRVSVVAGNAPDYLVADEVLRRDLDEAFEHNGKVRSVDHE
jgi:hypothetical protein